MTSIIAFEATEILAGQSELIEVGMTGPQGPPGDVGGLIQPIAGEDISALRVVTLNASEQAIYFDPSAANAFKAVGVSSSAATAGNPLSIVVTGKVDGGTWVAQAIYFAGPNGTLTTTPPTTGLSVVVGFAPDVNTFVVRIGEPIELS